MLDQKEAYLTHVDTHALALSLLQVAALLDVDAAAPHLLLPFVLHLHIGHLHGPDKPCKELHRDPRIQLCGPLQTSALRCKPAICRSQT